MRKIFSLFGAAGIAAMVALPVSSAPHASLEQRLSALELCVDSQQFLINVLALEIKHLHEKTDKQENKAAPHLLIPSFVDL